MNILLEKKFILEDASVVGNVIKPKPYSSFNVTT